MGVCAGDVLGEAERLEALERARLEREKAEAEERERKERQEALEQARRVLLERGNVQAASSPIEATSRRAHWVP